LIDFHQMLIDSAFHPLWDIKFITKTTQMVMNECSAYSSLHVDSKVEYAAWSTSWWPPGADRLSLRWPEWTLAHGFAIDDSTINIVLVLSTLLLFMTAFCSQSRVNTSATYHGEKRALYTLIM